jgi:hypothetical protein
MLYKPESAHGFPKEGYSEVSSVSSMICRAARGLAGRGTRTLQLQADDVSSELAVSSAEQVLDLRLLVV